MLDTPRDAFPFHPALLERILLRLGPGSQVWQHPMMRTWKSKKAVPTGRTRGTA